jgi:hypothetical protein
MAICAAALFSTGNIGVGIAACISFSINAVAVYMNVK